MRNKPAVALAAFVLAAAGDHIQVFYDGKNVIDAHDSTLADAGKFGVWTKADSIIQFDDLIATPK